MDQEPELSIVVTVLNEERAVEEVHRRTAAALDGRPCEIVFVDDGSTDGTFAALERLHARDPRVRAVRLKRNFGQHPAMHAGLVRARGGVIVTMDGDLQNEPEDIPRLVAAVERADVASGRRVGRRDSVARTRGSAACSRSTAAQVASVEPSSTRISSNGRPSSVVTVRR